MNMEEQLEQAIQLRKDGNFQEANQLLSVLWSQSPEDPIINYQYAWSFDVMGKESEAVPYYERAIANGLQVDLEAAYIGLGSTYRTIGEYEKARVTLENGLQIFPESHLLKTFYAMVLYNLKRYSDAMQLLLEALAHTTADVSLIRYQRALLYYADKLDQKWQGQED